MQKEIEEIEEIEEREITTTEEEDMDKNNNENREFYVYEHIRLDNMTCFYVGKGKGERAYDLERNDHHDRISNRHGHVVLIIKDNLTEKEAFDLERDTIEDYVFTFGYGIDIDGYRDYSNKKYLTNCTWGGEGVSGIHHSEETKQKIGESSKGRHHSEETKQKLSEMNKGKKLSEETKQMISESRKGMQISEEHKKNISKARKGMQISEEHKKNISKARKGMQFSEEHKKNISEANKGRKFSEEHKQNIGESVSGEKNGMWGKPSPNRSKVICTTTGKIFDCIKDAEKHYKCSNISSCCRKKTQSAGKLNGTPLKWKYLKDYNNDFKGILINPIAE